MAKSFGEALRECFLAGVAEGAMADVVAERGRLGEVLIEVQSARDGPRHLRHLECVGQASDVVIKRRRNEDLGLMF